MSIGQAHFSARASALWGRILIGTGVLLSACGGGGKPQAVPLATQPVAIDALLGTYTFSCDDLGAIDTASGAVVFHRLTLVIDRKTSPTTAIGRWRMDFFDDGCVAAPRFSMTAGEAGATLAVDGDETVAGQDVAKVTLSVAPPLAANGGATSSPAAAGITLLDPAFLGLALSVRKDVWLLDTEQNVLGGDSALALDADGYPTAILPATIAVRS